MVTPIIMPKFGQMTEDSAIVEWLKKEGDKVKQGDTLFTVETDKSVMEVESFQGRHLAQDCGGRGNKRSRAERRRLPRRGRRGRSRDAAAAARRRLQAQRRRQRSPRLRGQSARRLRLRSWLPWPRPPSQQRPPASASARAPRRSPEQSVIDPRPISGSGPEGRIVERDVKAYLEANDYQNLRVSPAAKALAAKENFDLIALRAENGSKRLEVADIERAIAEKPKPMSKMRQVIAERLAHSMVASPHFYVTVEVDMTEVIAVRARLNAAGARYSVTDFIASAAILALKEYPTVNSATDGKSVRWYSRVHLGIAVNLDQGLVVPVIRDANATDACRIERTLEGADRKAPARVASTPDDMSGSTFTISNMGMLDVENFTAIINPGESAILGGFQHDQEAGGARRRDRCAADHEDDAVVRPSSRRRRHGGALHQQHQVETRGQRTMDQYDVVVIGAGPGGYPAAIRAAQLGASVAIVERERYGGTCLNFGCIPTKALIASAEAFAHIRHAEELGVTVSGAKVNYAAMTERKDKVVAQLTGGVKQLLTANGVKQFTGTAAFKDRNTIAINGETLIGAKKTIIATGSTSAVPDFVPKHERVVESKSFLALTRLPAEPHRARGRLHRLRNRLHGGDARRQGHHRRAARRYFDAARRRPAERKFAPTWRERWACAC